jgi:nucleoside-diphosphate-sugar epimerase
MRLLITGATGFIGNHVMATLGQADSGEFTVVPWDRQKMGDIRNRKRRITVLKEHRPDVVLHLAWSSTENNAYQEDPANSSWGVLGVDLLHECLELGCWYIATGSAADMEGDSNYSSPYSDAKRYLRSVVEPYALSGQATWLRPQVVVSIADQRPRVVRQYLQRPLGSDFQMINPDAEFDFVEVRDVAQGIATTIRNGLKGVVDLGSGYLHSVAQLVAAVDSMEGARPSSTSPVAAPGKSECGMEPLLRTGWEPVYTRELFDVPVL